MSDHPGRYSARIVLGLLSQHPPYSWCFPLVLFHLWIPTLFSGYKSHWPMLCSQLSPISLPHCTIPLQCSQYLWQWSWIKSDFSYLTKVFEHFPSFLHFFILHPRIYHWFQRKRKGEGEWVGGREREKKHRCERTINQLPPKWAVTGDWTCNLGMCPNQESNPWPFGLQDNTPTNWAIPTRVNIFF